MSRTTPPRPADVVAYFPELAPLARTAVRLHPRPGAPTAAESSIGGPLLWPADEPWPTCPDHAGPWHLGYAPEEIQQTRRVVAAARNRPSYTADERAILLRTDKARRIDQDGPVPLLPIAQLYGRDVPALPAPEGTDLLQVLWCPFEHSENDHDIPRVLLRWRAPADVTAPLATPPQPSVIDRDDYLPVPCVLHPEVVTEYPAPHELPEDLAERVRAWEEELEEADGDEALCYQYDLSVAPGCKVGGHAPWAATDPYPMACAACGAPVRPLLTLGDCEWDGGSESWRPEEDAHEPGGYPGVAYPTGIQVGRDEYMQIYVCTASYNHPHLLNVQ